MSSSRTRSNIIADDGDDVSVPIVTTSAKLYNDNRGSTTARSRRPTLSRSSPGRIDLGLPTDRFSLRIPTNADANAHVYKHHGEFHWRSSLLNFVHHPAVQYTIMALLIIDVCILFTELFLDAEFPPCTIITRDAISCCMDNTTVDSTSHEHFFRWLASEGGGHHDVHNYCDEPLQDKPEYEATCDPHKYDGVHTAHAALFWTTIVILSIFLLELMIEIIALKPQVFFKQCFYVFDLFLVVVSLVLEITFHVVHSDTLAAYTGLIILARMWRFIRITHAIVEVTAEMTAGQHHRKVMNLVEELETLLEEYEQKHPGASTSASDADVDVDDLETSATSTTAEDGSKRRESETSTRKVFIKTHQLLTTIHENEEEDHHHLSK